MKPTWLALLLSLLCYCSFAQKVFKSSYPKTLESSTDTVWVRFSAWNKKHPEKISGRRDTVDIGTDGAIGMYATVFYGKDSVNFKYTHLPDKQIYYVPLESPKGKTVLQLRFGDVTAAFTTAYIKQNTGKVNVVIPEVYELANIIWTLSPSGSRAKDIYKEGPYYQKVTRYFKPYLNHPIFKKLDFTDTVAGNKYYEFRENSFEYHFAGDKIINTGPYYYVYGDDFDNLFKQLLPLIEDFAKKSHFKAFYDSNNLLYAARVARERQLLPIRNMWDWLENQFPNSKYQSYQIVFSPLIYRTHSTQNYGDYSHGNPYKEVDMFICGTDRYEQPQWTEKQKEGLMSGVVFTEIDHNYINPVTRKYVKTVDSIFSKTNRSIWAGNAAYFYGSPSTVFNEYMTHAAYCLWIVDNYDQATADVILNYRENLMVHDREFIKFKEFDRALIGMYQANKAIKVNDLYPAILNWCKLQVK